MAIPSDLRQRRLIKVFIASPGDLQPERRRTRDVVEEINHTLGRPVNVYVDLLGWEDTLPGTGRPQELINRDVDDCDLFIGLVWKRWGTPPGGIYTSGFEEEFERAQQCKQQTGKPEIWLAFKHVPQDQLNDPGDQLQRVLAFKRAEIAARRVLFKEFQDEENWATQLRGWLTSAIAQLLNNEMEALQEALRQPPQEQSSTPLGMASDTPSVSASSESMPSAIPPQLREVAEQFFQAATHNGGSFYPLIMRSLDQFQITRMFLTAKAWLASRFTYELLTTHEIHLLYKYREQLEFVGPEYDIVIRTLLGDRYASTAGWYWFADSEPVLTNYLFARAMHDPLTEVRAHTINLLNDASLYPPEGKVLSFVESILNDTDEDVQKATLDYLANSRNRVLLTLLDSKSLRNDSLGRSARLAALRLKISVDPVAAFTEMSSSHGSVSTDMLRMLEECIASIPSAMLVQAMESADRGMRGLAARTLLERGELTIDRARLLLTDESFRIRAIALEALIQQGTLLSPEAIEQYLKETPPAEGQGGTLASLASIAGREFVDPEKVIETLFETYSEEKLTQEIDWYNLYGPLAYHVLAQKYFTTNRDRIRHDLTTHFQDIRQKAIESIIESIIADLRRTHGLTVEQVQDVDRLLVGKEHAKVHDFIVVRYTAAALAGIALHGEPTDASMIREFLETSEPTAISSDIRLQALKYLRRFGNATDAELALQIAKTTHIEIGGSSVREEALKTAVALAPGITGIATELINSDEVDFVRAGVGAVWDEEPNIVKGMLFPLLRHTKTEVRNLAIAYFITRYPEELLEDLLREYLELPTYYYNVVCWFDRALYSPTALVPAYKKRFQKEIGDLDSWCIVRKESLNSPND